MDKEALVGKFYIIKLSQNWDKRLNKPVSLFHFGAEIDRDISIKKDITIANNSEFQLKFYKNCNILMRLGKGRFIQKVSWAQSS